MALLGKQAWRLCTGVDNLASRVLAGKYFPNSSFLHSELGHNPSFTWRSIWEAKKVMFKGLRRKIGNGTNTKIWEDAWIPGTQIGRIITTKPAECPWECVSDLIEEGEIQKGEIVFFTI
ncbi:hypothetical protein RND81_07G114900 [Saponaria officinalis]|uniref:Mitochondrial protein n=1 Tax=Saponaria officinalis TaxID=3572 RepID=A0AAW1JQU9_SAPOF